VRGKHFAGIHEHRQQRLPPPRPGARHIELSAPRTAGPGARAWCPGGRAERRPGQVRRPGAPVAAAVVGRAAGLQPRLAPVGHRSGPSGPAAAHRPARALGLSLRSASLTASAAASFLMHLSLLASIPASSPASHLFYSASPSTNLSLEPHCTPGVVAQFD
jgi:hypothetical protein